MPRSCSCEIAALYPVSVHSVGISVGSAGGIDRAHLARIKMLIDRIDPIMLSGHLAWSTHEGEYLNDLLPLPYHRESLAIVCDHISEVQDALGRAYHLENPSNYLGFGASTMTETEFLTRGRGAHRLPAAVRCLQHSRECPQPRL